MKREQIEKKAKEIARKIEDRLMETTAIQRGEIEPNTNYTITNCIRVKIKLIEDGKMPVKMHETDAGFDCYARAMAYYPEKKPAQIKYWLGFSIEIPKGYVGLIFPRSSVYKTNLDLSNAVGVIDSGYRGEVSAIFNTLGEPIVGYGSGDRVCQLIIMPYPEVELKQVEELSETERGECGYGSTGNK